MSINLARNRFSETPRLESENHPPVSGVQLWKKLGAAASAAGVTTVEHALTLYYTAASPNTPVWCKTVIYGALGYFISLIDGIPDLTPILGYTDDLTVMAGAIATIAAHITPEIRRQAQEKTAAWFKTDKKNTSQQGSN
ncbi:YkvA family protein [Hahella aquimaris]|uniref:YkvA family protein n=1 Tax=Hahella sp. HNIBRBA332 TaxID=3015983 RepID=UPI00273B0D5F|nr:YkvA family protein [Hahella sp. HNIBRBA332]WLQ14612.1 YkvA family protein [Hahella sp. HNIBRBA332]